MASEKQTPLLFNLSAVFADHLKSIGYEHDKYQTAEDIRLKMSSSEASKFISEAISYSQKHWSWRPASRQTLAAELSYQYAVEHGIRELAPRHYDSLVRIARKIGFQGDIWGLTFSRNSGGQRIPLSQMEAEDAFRKQLSAVVKYVNARLEKDRKRDQGGEDKSGGDQIPEPEEFEDAIPEPEPEEEEEPEPESEIGTLFENYWTRFVQLREFAGSHDIGGHKLDTLEIRVFKAAVGMLKQGIPMAAIDDATTMHWPDEARRTMGIERYDVRTFKSDHTIPAGMPAQYHYIVALAQARVFGWAIGPAGTGKTTGIGKVAKHLGLPFVIVPLNAGTSPSAINGRPKLSNTSIMVRFLKAMADQDEPEMVKLAKMAEEQGDVSVSEFTTAFTKGGWILLDELDRADPGLLMMLNAPLANDVFVNTAEGRTYQIHPDTRIWAASNTMGLGVSAGQGREYRAANALDFATIDRFRMGRFLVEGDIDQYRKIYESMVLADA